MSAGFSNVPQHRLMILTHPVRNVLFRVEAEEENLPLLPDESLYHSARLIFPSNIRRDHFEARCRGMRRMLLEDRDSGRPDPQKVTTAFGYAAVLGFWETLSPDAQGSRPPRWKFTIYNQEDPNRLGVLFQDIGLDNDPDDQVEPLLLADDDNGVALEQVIAVAVKRQDREGITAYPFRHLMSACFRTARIERMKKDAAKKAAQPVTAARSAEGPHLAAV